MRGAAAMAALAAVLGLGASPGGAARPPDELAQLYRMAHAYEISAGRRLCADRSLRPRFVAIARRLEVARRRMIAAYGRQFLSEPEPPVIMVGDPCRQPSGAANAIAGFETAVSQLQAGLAGRRRR